MYDGIWRLVRLQIHGRKLGEPVVSRIFALGSGVESAFGGLAFPTFASRHPYRRLPVLSIEPRKL
jgi:hypothetical protein